MQERGKMKKSTLLFSITFVFLLISGTTKAQCDFVNDITGLSLSTPPSGVAADPLQFTQVYVLVDDNGLIAATNSTPDFIAVTPGLYTIHAVNYGLIEVASITPLLTVGAPWSGITGYVGCLDYTDAYGGCYQSVCDEITELESATTTNVPSGFNTNASNTQEYCLVCGGMVQAVNSTGSFDLTLYPAAVAGADCEVVAMNYTSPTPPMAVGDNFSTNAAAMCGDCWDYLARDLQIVNVLPVELIGLKGSTDGPWNRLDWSTATELNNDKFIVERSHDGKIFEPIGEVAGIGTTTQQQDYVFHDRSPQANIEYYRLKQVDFDGAITTTKTVAIERSDMIDFNVYPNPTNGAITVALSSEEISSGTIALIDAKGNHVKAIDFSCSLTSTCETHLTLEGFAAGIYCVLVQDTLNGHTYQKRIVKR